MMRARFGSVVTPRGGTMRKLALIACAALVIGLVVGQVSAATTTGKSHRMTAEVVSVDVQAKTLTIKDDKGEEKTAPVLGKAVDRLKSLKAGEKVTLTCKDNEKGEHEGITAIAIAKAAKASKKS